jgi:hypothetical protein
MSERGYIAIARGSQDHPIVGARKPYSAYEAWHWLLFEAAWKPRRCAAGCLIVELQRGQLAHSTRYMAKAWGWPETNVRRFLERLKTGAQIDAETGAGITVITVTNYDAYQRTPLESGAEGGAAGRAKVAQQRRRKEEGNNININARSRADEPEGFAEWYTAYPRKTQRKAAAQAYRRNVPKEISAADLLASTTVFAEHWRRRPTRDLEYCPYPASYLNSGQYLDQLAEQGPKIEAPTRDPKTFTEAEWRDRIAGYRKGEPWPDKYWGPAPGSPGCLVPAHLVIEAATPLVVANGAQ